MAKFMPTPKQWRQSSCRNSRHPRIVTSLFHMVELSAWRTCQGICHLEAKRLHTGEFIFCVSLNTVPPVIYILGATPFP